MADLREQARRNAEEAPHRPWRNRAMADAEKAWWSNKIRNLKSEFLATFGTETR